MATSSQNASVSDQGLLPFRRRIQCTTEVSLSFDEVERAARVCLGQLVPEVLSDTAASDSTMVAPMRRGLRALKVAVEPEVSTARTRAGVVGHVHWHAGRLRRFVPVMEADLVARPLSGRRTRLILEASYRPPGGVLGVIGDVLIGRLIARETAKAFTDHLAQAMEHAVRGGRCGTSHGTKGGPA